MKNLAIVISFLLCASLAVAKDKPKTVYIPMDYSYCGYHASECAIPNVRHVISVKSHAGDCTRLLQSAIDYVSALKKGKDGFRGAILLDEGTYNIEKPLRISVSGVVVRGVDKDKTIILKHGVDRGAIIYVEGMKSLSSGDTLDITDDYVRAGSKSFSVSNADKVKVGSHISVLRPSTWEWINKLGCGDFGGGLDYTGWKPTDMDIVWARTVTAVKGNVVTLDAPLTSSLSRAYGGGKLVLSYNKGEISECGIENLTLLSDYDLSNAKDEDHAWDGILMDNASDCWVGRVNFKYLSGSAVNIQKRCRRITVEDCISSEPTSEIGGWRRCTFLTRGTQTLVQRCVSKNGIHDFVAGYCAAGPNAFVQCEGESSLGFSGSIGSWATGLLFDIVNIDGNDLRFANLQQFQFGTGWNTANSMMWQCTASSIDNYSPDSCDRNSANGCWGTLNGNGCWMNSNEHIQPRSLFYSQLQARVGKQAVDGFILPRGAEDASSSPTLEEAARLAKISLTQPRLTMEMWIDSVCQKEDALSGGKRYEITSAKLFAPPAGASSKKESSLPQFGIINGKLTFQGRLITGNKYDIPWWAGRVKDNFCDTQAKPAITRFVPGREGTGWTDRIDSVAAYMHKNHYCILDQHYGLWYDLRRTDHERIRRADGDVWAPFYEQTFSRSGKGIANDGLSRYDLTRPNRWYWQRLRDYAHTGASMGQLLFSSHYFQHNILEAGAHWVDCPWRPVNNINATDFPEPVPFTGDKRIFMAEQFYNEKDSVLRPLHQQYIRQCMAQLADQPNAVQLISDEYTGPLHFTKFWLETIGAWEKETGKKPLVALGCTKDAQDSILQNQELSKLVDIIEIKYWHYHTKGIWAPPAGANMAPRQFMRKMKVGKTGFEEAYRAVREYRDAYPQKSVVFFSQQYPEYGWAILFAGGSCPDIPVTDKKFLSDAVYMNPMLSTAAYKLLGCEDKGYMIYPLDEKKINVNIKPGIYQVYAINVKTGKTDILHKLLKTNGLYSEEVKDGIVLWLENIKKS